MKVAVFGGTGFVGNYLVEALLRERHEPVLLVRHGSERRCPDGEAVNLVWGDIGDRRSVARTLEGCDAAIYNIGLLREFPQRGITFRAMHFEGARRAMRLAEHAGVGRFVLMSANGVNAEGTAYQRTKYMAEEYLKTTGLDWTVFRPSVIFGPPRGRMEFATRLQQDVVRSPMPAPLFFDGLLPVGAGCFRLSPVHVEDLARVFARSLDDRDAIGRVSAVGGPEAVMWKELLRRIAEATGNSLTAVPVPAWGVRPVASMLDRFEFFPVTRDQLDMLMSGNTCDSRDLFEAYDIEPRRFDGDSLGYLAGDRTVENVSGSVSQASGV
jgi:NADH dehydrogenase